MKTLVAAIVAISLAGSAFAVTPEQAGIYTGTMTLSVSPLDVKKGPKAVKPMIMAIMENGQIEVASELANFGGQAVLGPYRGFLNVEAEQFMLTVKGSSLTGSARFAIGSSAEDGAIFDYQIKVKRASNLY